MSALASAASAPRTPSPGTTARHRCRSGRATSGRHRLSRGGNRQLNLALHRIAITQMRIDERGRAYIEHRRTAGDTKTEAIRALRRRISDEVYRRLSADETPRANAASALTAVAA